MASEVTSHATMTPNLSMDDMIQDAMDRLGVSREEAIVALDEERAAEKAEWAALGDQLAED